MHALLLVNLLAFPIGARERGALARLSRQSNHDSQPPPNRHRACAELKLEKLGRDCSLEEVTAAFDSVRNRHVSEIMHPGAHSIKTNYQSYLSLDCSMFTYFSLLLRPYAARQA